MIPHNACLIVDDERNVRVFLKRLLREIGVAKVSEASNGREAVELYSSEHPDVVFMDVSMPEVNGIDALKAIRECDADARVVMMSALASQKTVEDCAEAGAAYYIRKDNPRERILAELRGYINNAA